jgi:hypothetical protein
MSTANLAERIRRGEMAIAAAKAQGRDVTDWEQHLERLKRETLVQELPPRAWVVEEIRGELDDLRAVMIRSAVLNDELWLIIDLTFKPQDNRAVYYPKSCANSGPRPQNSCARSTRSSSLSPAAE